MNFKKMLFKQNTTFIKVEFWAFTAIFAFVLFFFISDGFNGNHFPHQPDFVEASVPFNFYRNFFIPQLIQNLVLFLALVCLNFIIVPKLINGKKIILNGFFFVLVLLTLLVSFGITDYYLKEYSFVQAGAAMVDTMLSQGLMHMWVVLVAFAIYTSIKYISLYLLAISSKLEMKYRFIRREAIVATFIWMVILLFLSMETAPRFGIAAWIIAVPSAILLYLAGFYTLIPSSLNQRYPFITYALKNALILFIGLMAWGLILKLVVGGVLKGDLAPLASLWVMNAVLQMFVTIPVTWWLYKKFQKGDEQITRLKQELGQSNANIDFLRSQINPHFLFNALNTIYGTALQEGAARSSEAVQKLGDMMRFMLQENMRDKISLMREIEYLENYISLQKLRTDAHPNILIEISIDTPDKPMQIAPMLLIPFIENAFKHGISFREPSHIKINLVITGNKIYFDVYNLKHLKMENDPEKNNNGIGLQNVQQRLQLLYPGKHELNIQETADKFFVHLMVEVEKFG